MWLHFRILDVQKSNWTSTLKLWGVAGSFREYSVVVLIHRKRMNSCLKFEISVCLPKAALMASLYLSW